MNRIYRSIWNSRTNTYTAVSELARSAGKATASGLAGTGASFFLTLKTLAASLMIAGMAAPAWAADLPTNGNVVIGTGTISQNGTAMTIHQGTDKLGIDWNSFNIGQGNSVTFVQPNASSVALNRVLGSDPSSIMGNLSANGQVFLVNPNGVLFGSSAQVNVGGLVASTLDISNQDFINGKYAFKGNGTNQSVVNKGIIHADGGVVALLGGRVSNEGIIQAKAGTVALAAGNSMTLDFAGDGLVSIAVDEGTANALVENKQLIEVEGGHVILSAQAADTAASVVINQTGIIRALSTVEQNGKIILSSNGDVAVSGTLDVANNDAGQGGDIEITGRDITLTHATLNANGKTGGGTIKIGGDYQGQGTLAHADNVTIDQGSTLTADATHTGAGGTIVAWSDGKTSATGSFSAKGKTGNGGLVETSGEQIDFNGIRVNTLSEQGKGGEWLIDPIDLTVDAAAAATINTNLQTSNITLLTNATTTVGPGTPTSGAGNININAAIGWSSNRTLTLSAYNNINVNAAIKATGNAAGLVLNYGSNGSAAANYNVKAPITLSGAGATLRINGYNYTLIHNMGQLAAMSGSSGYYALGNSLDASGVTYADAVVKIFPNAIFAGMGHQISNLKINATQNDVGLFGQVSNSEIRDLGVVNADVKGEIGVGVLVGNMLGSTNKIHHVYATGSVSSSGIVGGLIGHLAAGSVSDAYAAVEVTATQDFVGGFVGYSNNYTTIKHAYATGSVKGAGYAGGFVGFNQSTIAYAYATGNVYAKNVNAGGFAGINYRNIANAYATGVTQGGSFFGGFTGENQGTLDKVFWDSFSTGQAHGVGREHNVGQFAIEMTSDPAQSGAANYAYQQSAYSGLDFTNDWFMIEGETRPFLRSEYSTTIANAHQLQLMAMDLSAHYTLANDINAIATNGGNTAGMWTSRGFVTIGTASNPFNGTLDGQSRVINDLTIKRATTNDVGLIGALGVDGVIEHVGVVNADITGQDQVGILAAKSSGTIRNAFATGKVNGQDNVGGLVGQTFAGSLSNAYATSDVSGRMFVGGLVGSSSFTSIQNTYAAGRITGTAVGIGGLVGSLMLGKVRNSYAMGEVTTNGNNAGGLVAINTGLFGSKGEIEDSYYATTDAGGRAINNALPGDDGYGVGKRHSELMQSSTFANWDLDNTGGTGSVWRIYDGYTTPLLRSFLKQVTVTIDPQVLADKMYDGQVISGTAAGYSTSVAGAALSGALDYVTNSANAATYQTSDGSLKLGGLHSGQTGYDISYANSRTAITPKTLTVSGVVADNKTYDGTTAATLSNVGALNGLIAGEALTVISSAEFDTKHAGTGKTVTATHNLADGNNGLASNYVLSSTPVTTTADVAAKAINGTISANNKTYDGTTGVVLTGALQGFVAGDLIGIAATGHFIDASVGQQKDVIVDSAVLSGADAGNYVLAGYNQSTQANIDNAAQTLPTDYARLPGNLEIKENNHQNLIEIVGTGLLDTHRMADGKPVQATVVSQSR